MSLDPITTEVIINRIRETTAAMAHALFHSGYSPILRESQDGTAGLCDAAGRVIMVGGGLQYHSLLYTRAVESVCERYPLAEMRDGDSFISNDPYKAGNSHVPDVVVITPIFHGGEIIAFGASVAHKADVGGLVPGSSGAGAREIFHDGILIPPVRYWSKDGVNREVDAILRNNSRIPEVVIGDLRGQVGSTRLGAERLCALCDEYGVETMRAAMASLIERTGARVRSEIARWPDGAHSAEALLDHDGADRSKPVRIKVTARKRGDRLTLDFSGTDAQAKGPVNTPLPPGRDRGLRPHHPDEFRRARCGRFRHACGHAGASAVSCDGEPLFSNLPHRLHLCAGGAGKVQSGARRCPGGFRDRRYRHRICQRPHRQADRAVRADGDLARRHEQP
jgi:N-methylhydantoinase B